MHDVPPLETESGISGTRFGCHSLRSLRLHNCSIIRLRPSHAVRVWRAGRSTQADCCFEGVEFPQALLLSDVDLSLR